MARWPEPLTEENSKDGTATQCSQTESESPGDGGKNESTKPELSWTGCEAEHNCRPEVRLSFVTAMRVDHFFTVRLTLQVLLHQAGGSSCVGELWHDCRSPPKSR